MIVPIAGFLGAGKTFLILAGARVLRNRNLNCAAILNDQGANLVDTEYVREQQISANEVAGGCFCCRFSDLIDRAEELRKLNPEIIFMEAVGSCADLSATVIQPLKRDFRDRFRIAPLTVAVDPTQARQMSELPESSELRYLFHSQMEEADLVAFTKCDLGLEPDNIGEVETRYVSSLTGEGVSEWLDEILTGTTPAGSKILQIDYDRYARAEAALGWLNWHAQVRLSYPLSPAELVGPFLDALQLAVSSNGGEIMHLKVSDDTESSYLKVSTTSSHLEPHAEGDLTASPEMKHELRLKTPKLLLNNNFSGKPEDIYLFLGRHPKAAFGNSTGDQQMLEYAQASGGASLRMMVYHDDAKREYAYGPAGGLPDTKVGTFSQPLMDEAKKDGWNIISMKKDWKRIFAFET